MSTMLCATAMKAEGGGGGGGGEMTSKGDGLLRSNLPLGDTILRGASYFVTVWLSGIYLRSLVIFIFIFLPAYRVMFLT